MQQIKNGGACVGENMSQRTQSIYDVNQSHRVFDMNDETISRTSHLQF